MISRANLRFFKSLQERKVRTETGLFLVEGLKPVGEALRAGLQPEWILCARSFALPVPAFAQTEILSDEDFSRISTLKSPEGILGIFPIPPSGMPVPSPAFALETLQDPGNIGAILRIADWFGIPGIVLSPDCADPWQPKVVRASMGSLLRTRIAIAEDFDAYLEAHTDRLLVADLEGEPLGTAPWPQDPILLFGNEARGVSEHWRTHPRVRKIAIPGAGNAESLNVAVAAGIFAWHWYTQTHPTQ